MNGRKLACCAFFLEGIACAPRYHRPCSPGPGFDQEVRVAPAYVHANEGPGIVHVPSPASRTEVLDTLRAIARALLDAPKDNRLDIHVDIPLAYFEGLTCAQIFTSLAAPDFCLSKPTEAMISLYYLPPNYAGGGRELFLHFDESGRCDGARWCATQ